MQRVIVRLPKHLQQLLALEAVAISLHSALVWDIATREESSNVYAQASQEFCVENAIKIVGHSLQTISLHIAMHVGVNNLYFFAADVVGKGLFPQVEPDRLARRE